MRRLHATLGETLALVDMMLFNFLIGNADAHAKNYSVVYPDLSTECPSPVYGEIRRVIAGQVAAVA